MGLLASPGLRSAPRTLFLLIEVAFEQLADGAAQYTPGIGERRSGVSTFLHSGIKNADGQTGLAQSLTATRVYDAFGNVDGSTDTWQGPDAGNESR